LSSGLPPVACIYLQLWPVFPMHADSSSRFLCVCVFFDKFPSEMQECRIRRAAKEI
jgi:hypothetical protein